MLFFIFIFYKNIRININKILNYIGSFVCNRFTCFIFAAVEEIQDEGLKKLKQDVNRLREVLNETAMEMIDEGFTQFPIFIAANAELPIGELFIDSDEYKTHFSFYATTLEECNEKNIIEPGRTASFKNTVKNPKKNMSILLVEPTGMKFVFLPFTPTPPTKN